MKFFFIVQGEGRGHMTQAIALRDMLVSHGHELVQVMVGKSERREVPKFFYEKILAPVDTFESPNFVTDKANKSIDIVGTILFNLKRQSIYFGNMKKLDAIVKATAPDVIVNFYDLLGGIYNKLYKPKAKFIVIGHQYFLQHPAFEFPLGRSIEKYLVNINSNITASGAYKKLSLSFREEKDHPSAKNFVVPPLLRKDIALLNPTVGDYILGYSVNYGYGNDVQAWHKNNKETKIHYFWDRKQESPEWSPEENLTFHQLNDVKFLKYMENCMGYISSAGFESVCEAMYLGKPIMMIPTEGQYEQLCNATDAVKSGAGIMSETFDLTKFKEYLPHHKSVHEDYKKWLSKAEALFLKHLTT